MERGVDSGGGGQALEAERGVGNGIKGGQGLDLENWFRES